MGYFTPILINNDRLREIEADPQRFAEQVIRFASGGPAEWIDIPGAQALAPAHLDSFRVLVVTGGMFIEMDTSARPTRELLDGRPYQGEIVWSAWENAKHALNRMHRNMLERWRRPNHDDLDAQEG